MMWFICKTMQSCFPKSTICMKNGCLHIIWHQRRKGLFLASQTGTDILYVISLLGDLSTQPFLFDISFGPFFWQFLMTVSEHQGCVWGCPCDLRKQDKQENLKVDFASTNLYHSPFQFSGMRSQLRLASFYGKILALWPVDVRMAGWYVYTQR